MCVDTSDILRVCCMFMDRVYVGVCAVVVIGAHVHYRLVIIKVFYALISIVISHQVHIYHPPTK